MRLRDFTKIKIGTSIRVSKAFKKFHKEKAYEFNTIGGASTQLMTQKDAETSFFSWLLIGNGFSYKAKVIASFSDVGEGPGCRIEFTFAHGLKYSTIVSYKDLTIIGVKK